MNSSQPSGRSAWPRRLRPSRPASSCSRPASRPSPGRATPRICAARTPAFVAPGLPMDTVATGTPGGICTVDEQRVEPFQRRRIDRHADHRQGRVRGDDARQVRGGAGADDEQLARRGRALRRTRRITRSGERCADATVISLEIPNSFNTSTAACITGASESEPIRISTSIWDIQTGSGLMARRARSAFGADVAAILHALERDPRDAPRYARAIACRVVGAAWRRR